MGRGATGLCVVRVLRLLSVGDQTHTLVVWGWHLLIPKVVIRGSLHSSPNLMLLKILLHRYSIRFS